MTVIWALFVLSVTQSVGGLVTGTLHKSHKDGPTRREGGQSIHEDGPTRNEDGRSVHKNGPTQNKDGQSVHKDGPPIQEDGQSVHEAGQSVVEDDPPVDEDDPPRQEDGPSVQERGSTLFSKKNYSLEVLVQSSKSFNSSTNTKTHNVSTSSNLLSNLTNTATNNVSTSSKLLSNLTDATTNNVSTSNLLSILTNYPTNLPGLNSDDFSCRHSCGIVRAMPCSCDVKCLVLRTCCEDMAAECPDVVMETTQTYGHMLDAGTTCSNHLGFGYFLITTCPKHNFTSRYQKPELFEKKDDKWEPGIFSSSQQSRKLVEIFNNVPIADKATNFDYVNLTIFECNAMNGSVPVSWEVMFSVDIYIGAPLNAAYLSQNILNDDKPSYFLPLQLVETNSRSKCYAPSINSCNNNFKNGTDKLADKCRQFFSFVFLDYFYNNKYCAFCNGVNEKNLMLFIDTESDQKRHSHEFSVLASFDGQGFTFTPLGQFFSWETSECTAKGPKVDPTRLDNFSCQMEKCKSGFDKMPNGLCVKKYFMQVAIEDNGFPMSAIEQRQLPRFLECYFKAHVNFHGLHAESPVQIRFAGRLNQIMYNTVMVYFETAIMPMEIHLVMPILETMVKSLTVRRLQQNKKLYAAHTNRIESMPLALLTVDSIVAQPCKQLNSISKTINATYCISKCHILNLSDCAYNCYIVCVETSNMNVNHTDKNHTDISHTDKSHTDKSHTDKDDVDNFCFHLLNNQSRSVWPSILFAWIIALHIYLAFNTV